jgi:hypothetical protein
MITCNIQDYIDILDTYTVNNELGSCDILHLYPQRPAHPDGYPDMQFFTCVIFNTRTMEKCVLYNKDSIDTSFSNVRGVGIYIDGSTIIMLEGVHEVIDTQKVYLRKNTILK